MLTPTLAAVAINSTLLFTLDEATEEVEETREVEG
jgi:hypothetical protein